MWRSTHIQCWRDGLYELQYDSLTLVTYDASPRIKRKLSTGIFVNGVAAVDDDDDDGDDEDIAAWLTVSTLGWWYCWIVWRWPRMVLRTRGQCCSSAIHRDELPSVLARPRTQSPNPLPMSSLTTGRAPLLLLLLLDDDEEEDDSDDGDDNEVNTGWLVLNQWSISNWWQWSWSRWYCSCAIHFTNSCVRPLHVWEWLVHVHIRLRNRTSSVGNRSTSGS